MSKSIGALLTTLSSPTRRQALAAVANQESMRTSDLALHVASAELETPLVEVPSDAHERALVGLHHAHLPKLADAGFVEWDRDADAVEILANPLLEWAPVADVLDDPDAVTQAEERLFEGLAKRRRRTVVSILADADGPLSTARLARAVAERDGGYAAPVEEPPEELIAALYHVDLPKLADTGLVAHDPDRETATYDGHLAFDGSWLETLTVEGSDAVRRSSDGGSVRTVEGREAVTAYGQSLVDAADDELFVMITTDELLEEQCITRISNAVDRGVDVYLGSQTSAVRDLIRQRVPEVTIWEPQLDWLNFQPQRERLGRLVFADREAVMLGSVGEDGPEGTTRETAIVGAGTDNSLVVLVQELLGPRLEHLDRQSPDLTDHLSL